MRTVARHAVALFLGLAFFFAYFMYGFPWRMQWIPIPLFLAAVSAALVLPCRLQGRLSLGVLVTYCAPVTIVSLALSTANGFTQATVEPIAAVCGGACIAWVLSNGLDRVASALKQRRSEES